MSVNGWPDDSVKDRPMRGVVGVLDTWYIRWTSENVKISWQVIVWKAVLSAQAERLIVYTDGVELLSRQASSSPWAIRPSRWTTTPSPPKCPWWLHYSRSASIVLRSVGIGRTSVSGAASQERDCNGFDKRVLRIHLCDEVEISAPFSIHSKQKQRTEGLQDWADRRV